MTEGLDQLTEKEKEALRLLLVGHDAKSSAAELDVSVHTINDRLRNARRKLDVSSSREAARILGDAEGGIPQSVAYNDFGMAAEQAAGETADLTAISRTVSSRAVWFAGGMLMISLIIAAGVVAFVNSSSEPVTQTSSTTWEPSEEAESLPLVRAFLAELDAGDWEGSWDVAGPFIQGRLTSAQWTATIAPVRQRLGAVRSRELVSVDRTGVLPDAPPGDYEVLQFRTRFAHRETPAVERVVMVQGEDGWELAGYYIV